MNYWERVQTAAGMGGVYPWVLLATVITAIALFAVVPGAASRLRMAIVLALLSFPGLLLCGYLLTQGVPQTEHFYRWVHFISLLLFWLGTINIASVLLFRVILSNARVQPPPILRDALLGFAYLVMVLALMSRHGVELGEIIATSAVITAIIGFSLQDTLGNIMGGVALQLERSIVAGDWVRLGETEGIVREIRWRQTSLETGSGDTIVVPNSQLMKSQVTILGRREGKPRLYTALLKFQVDFRHAPTTVNEAVQGALAAEPIPNVAPDPPPECTFQDFAESYGTYGVRYWLSDFTKMSGTSAEVRTRIFFALQRAGIHPSIPAQSVFMTLEGRSRERLKRQEESDRRMAALRGVAIFEPLKQEELALLAERLHVAPFRRGEVIVRQGHEADHLYLVSRGTVSVRLADGKGGQREIGTIGAGEVFGEMALMTGEPRTATVAALSDVVCYRLDKGAFADVLGQRPSIAEAIAELMALRKVNLESAKEGLSAEARQKRIAPASVDLLHRIRKYFNLT